jgi:DNA polymerase-1
MLKEKLAHFDLLAIDTETTGLDINRATVVFWSLSTGDDRYFLESKMLEEFRPVLSDRMMSWVGSQIKYDANILANSGFALEGDLMCTLTMDRLVDPGRPHDLKSSYTREFGEKMATFAETFYPKDSRGKPRKPQKKEMYEILTEVYEQDPGRVVDYASMDAWAVLRLFHRLKENLESTVTWAGHTLWDVFLWFEVPFTRVLYNMERRGIRLDTKYFNEMRPKIVDDIASTEKKLNRLAGTVINPNSNPQIADLLFNKLKLQPIKFTSGGSSGQKKPSVDASVLQHYVDEGIEEAKLILKHRELGKLLGTYVDGLLERKDAKDRIHTTFTQHVADTSRLSSREPNIQNQPRARDDFDIRTGFIAGPRKKLVVADYEQLEMFILAHFSKDSGMIANIKAGKDIHTSNVELVWGEPYDDVTAAKKNKNDHSDRAKYLRVLRTYIKVIGFGPQAAEAELKLSSQRGSLKEISLPW